MKKIKITYLLSEFFLGKNEQKKNEFDSFSGHLLFFYSMHLKSLPIYPKIGKETSENGKREKKNWINK